MTTAMASAPVAIAARKRVVAFEAPQQETRALQNARRSAVNALKETKQVIAAPKSWARGSVSIRDQQLYALVLYLLSEEGALKHPRNHAMLVQAIVNRLISSNKQQSAAVGSLQTNDQATWLYRQDPLCSYTIAAAAASCKQDNRNASKGLLVLLAFRPDPVLPLCWTSTRRAVRFVNAVVSLVTANAFISTLGGGHFLCKHLDQAKLMAKIQIAVSVGLQDPILESKCRVNLAYGAMQGGRFRRAYRIIEQEFVVAKQLESDELDKICHAAKVYLIKTYRLHKEYLRNMAELGKSERLFDNFYRQRIVRAAK